MPPPQVPAESACPVSLRQQRWIESSMTWFGREFGPEVAQRDIVQPGRFLPEAYTGTPEEITAITGRVCLQMDVDPAALTVNMFDGSAAKEQARRDRSSRRRAVGHFRMEDGKAVIDLDQSESADPKILTAIMAHELCHVRLIGEGRITTAARPDHERLTDLLAVYFGFGIIMANTAVSYGRADRTWSVLPVGDLDDLALNDRALNAASRHEAYQRLGYLSEPEFGYALACYCRLRGEPAPGWARALDPVPQTCLTRGLSLLAQADPGPELPTQQHMGKSVRCGNATIQVTALPANASAPIGLVLPR